MTGASDLLLPCYLTNAGKYQTRHWKLHRHGAIKKGRSLGFSTQMIHQQRRCASQIWQCRVTMHSSKIQLFIRRFKRGSSATESVWNCYIVLHCSRFMHTCTSCAWTELGMAGPGYRANCCLTTVASPCKAVLGIKCQVTPPHSMVGRMRPP